MKKIFFTASILLANIAWAQPSFDLRISRGEDSDSLVFTANYDEDIYACYLELADLKVVGSEIRATINDVAPRRCHYVEAPDFGIINLTSLKLTGGLYKVFINDIAQGTLDAQAMKLTSQDSKGPQDPVSPQDPEFF